MAMEKYSYIGWTPCVNGHLDFGLAKVGISGGFTNKGYKDDKVVDKNYNLGGVGDSDCRAIVLQSKVDWRDTNNDNERSGLFRVFLAGTVTKSPSMNDRGLEGNVLVYHLNAEPDTEEKIKALKVHCLAHGISESNVQEKFPEFLEHISSARNVSGLESDCLVASLHFLVKPNGLAYLRYNDSNISVEDESSRFIMARQAFYYIKYSLHSHRHHLNEQDSLTTITPNDADCGLRLLCQLKRELTSLSRIQKIDEKIHETSNALGIVSYAKSLVSGLEEDGLLSSVAAVRERDRLDNIGLSFSSQESKISMLDDLVERHKSKAKVWLGFLLISTWSIINFYFHVDKKPSVDSSLLSLPGLPILVFFTAFFTYKVIVSYYIRLASPQSHEKTYLYASTPLINKIILPVVLLVVCLLVLLT